VDLGGQHLTAAHNNQPICGAAVVGKRLVMRRGDSNAWDDVYHRLGRRKLKSIFLETTFFFATVCPDRFFFPAKTNNVPFNFISLIFKKEHYFVEFFK